MTPLSRRTLLRGACACAGGCLGIHLPAFAQADPFPTKPMVVKVAFPAGGPADVSIRAASVVLQRSLGQPLVAESMPGANGSLSAVFVARAKADGYTLLGTTGIDFLVAPLTIASAKYDPVAFKLVGVAGISDFVLVSNATHDFKSIDELVEHARKPGSKELSIAHWGTGSAPHLVAADFQARTGVRFLEVPYKGAAPTIADIAGAQVDLTFVPLGGPTLGMIQNGKMRPIALASPQRNPALPDVPTVGESRLLKNFDYSLWSALLAPPDTPEPVVARLTAAMNEWIVSPENQARIKTNASRRLDPMSPAQAAAFLRAERDKFTRVARSLKLDPQ
jgi:tripartite-type tricarboxylate transporter receptor subunit TctC